MPLELIDLQVPLETKQSKALRSSVFIQKTAQWPTANFETFAKEGYAQNPDVFACVKLKQSAVAGIPLQLFKTNSASDKPIKKHPLLDLLKRPNPYQSYGQWVSAVVGDLEITGNSFTERVGPEKYAKTKPKELYQLRPERMSVISGDKINPVSGYKYGNDVDLTLWQVMHLKYYNPKSDYYGLSPLEAAANAVDQNNAAALWNYSMFTNAGRPSGILTITEEVLDENSFNDIVNTLKNEYTGASNAGSVMVLSGDMKWTSTSFNPMEMDFRQMYILNTRKIAACFGVPPQLISEESSKTYSNYTEARVSFYKETILPFMDWFLGELNVWLTPLFGDGLELRYDSDAIEAIQEDTNARYDRALRALAGGASTVNETRSIMNLKDVPNGDERLIPLNLIPESLREQMAQVQTGGGGWEQSWQQNTANQQQEKAPMPEQPPGRPKEDLKPDAGLPKKKQT